MQALASLEVVDVFYLDKKMMYQDPIGLLQCIGDVVEGLSGIKSTHLLKVKHDTVMEGIPSFDGSLGGSLGVGVSQDILPRSFCHLGLYHFLSRLSGLVGEQIVI